MNKRRLITLGGLLLASLAQADDCRQQLPAWIDMAHPWHAAGLAPVDGECQTIEDDPRRDQFRIEYGEGRYPLPLELSPI